MSTTLHPQPAATATTWQIDPSHTHVEFAVRHLMISTVKGRFGGIEGVVTTDGDDFSKASVEATIDVASIDTREPQRDAHLKSADFFDVERFPTLTFRSRAITPRGDGEFALTGDLTIHGVTREVTFAVSAEGAGRDPWGNQRAGFSAKATISRKDFGLTWNQVLETGGIAVGDEVKISIDTELIAKAVAA